MGKSKKSKKIEKLERALHNSGLTFKMRPYEVDSWRPVIAVRFRTGDVFRNLNARRVSKVIYTLTKCGVYINPCEELFTAMELLANEYAVRNPEVRW